MKLASAQCYQAVISPRILCLHRMRHVDFKRFLWKSGCIKAKFHQNPGSIKKL